MKTVTPYVHQSLTPHILALGSMPLLAPDEVIDTREWVIKGSTSLGEGALGPWLAHLRAGWGYFLVKTNADGSAVPLTGVTVAPKRRG